MAAILFGSARHDENGNYTGGAAGDQTGSEVSTQTMYTHAKGWYILRPKSAAHATALADAMQQACANDDIGYDQGQRQTVIADLTRYGTLRAIAAPCECDCSSLVRACAIQATGADPGSFTTANEASMLAATGLFEDKIAYVSQAKTPVYNGDILVTRTKGHTGIIVSGSPRTAAAQTGGFNVSALSTIKSGSTGAEVKSLQLLLNGKNAAGLTVDGIAGAKTVAAIKAYQKKKGLTQDGQAGINTWSSLLTK